MANYCPECGGRTSNNICSNCQEELHIFTLKYDAIEDLSFSDETAKTTEEKNWDLMYKLFEKKE